MVFTSVSVLLDMMSSDQSKIMRHIFSKNCQEIKRSTEPDSKMTQMLEPLGRNFKITISNMSKNIVEKVDNIHKGNFNRKM